MVNVYFGNIQLNTGNVKVNVESSRVRPNINMATYPIRGKQNPVVFPVSGDTTTLDMKFTLYLRGGGSFQELKNKEREIFDLVGNQIDSREPVLIRTVAESGEDDTLLYLNATAVYLYLVDPEFDTKGSNGKNFIEFTISGIVIGIPPFAGGTTIITNYFNITSL